MFHRILSKKINNINCTNNVHVLNNFHKIINTKSNNITRFYSQTSKQTNKKSMKSALIMLGLGGIGYSIGRLRREYINDQYVPFRDVTSNDLGNVYVYMYLYICMCIYVYMYIYMMNRYIMDRYIYVYDM